MKIKKYKIGIVIPTHNRKNHLRVVLDCIKNQRIDGVHIETIVVVDGSTDGTIEMLENDFPEVHIVKGTGNWWFTKSLNEGIKFSERFNPSHVLTLNDDVELPKDYLSNLILSYNQIGKNCVMGSASYSLSDPKILLFAGVKEINKFRLKYICYYESYKKISSQSLSGSYISKVLPTRGMLFPLSLAKKLNYFDEIFPQYGSDYDFTLRALKEGINSYISYDAYLFENNKLTGKGSPNINQSIIEYTKRLFYKHSPNYIVKNLRIIWRHYYKILFPFYFPLMLLSVYHAYFKYKKLRRINEIRNNYPHQE